MKKSNQRVLRFWTLSGKALVLGKLTTSSLSPNLLCHFLIGVVHFN
jgi:hypothetical protein